MKIERLSVIFGRMKIKRVIAISTLVLILTGCGSNQISESGNASSELQGVVEENLTTGEGTIEVATEEGATEENYPYKLGETANDSAVNFENLININPDVVAWIKVPGTNIDYPILQSGESDDYYLSHNSLKENDDSGAVYIEMANLSSMNDFNTVVHGKGNATGLFRELSSFSNPEFFGKNELFYIYLDGNVLSYEVITAYERENNSLIRNYDFTYIDGCKQFLNDMYNQKSMGKLLRAGWENLTDRNFLVTLTLEDESKPDSQFVVIGALVSDAAGTIKGVVFE